jgi:hypothetical protein
LHRKEVEFDQGKVLLSRLGDKIHATSAFCTHYGAPLAKGVLASDGRVVWFVHPHASHVNLMLILTCEQPMAWRYVYSLSHHHARY